MRKTILRNVGIALITGCTFLPQLSQASDETISGNLTVTGTIDGAGNTLSFGTRTDTADYPGWAALYTDGATSSLEFDATRSANVWKWQQNGSTTLQLQMTLDNNNTLTLFDQSSTPNANIVLNPLGTSTFANSVTINGIDTELPNQTLINANSVLTRGLADNRYLSFGSASDSFGNTGSTVAINNAIATGVYSFANGNGSTASNYGSMASGDSTASGEFSTAMGTSTANGDNAAAIGQDSSAIGDGSIAMGQYSTANAAGSVAMGNFSNATGWNSVALGGANASGESSMALGGGSASGYLSTALGGEATGYGSVSMGFGSIASGTYSTALAASTASGTYSTATGYLTAATAYASFAVGRANVGGGNAGAWVDTDPLFEVGNGTGRTHGTPADALVVYKNGNAAIQGNVTAASVTTNGNVTAANINTTGAISSTGVITANSGVLTSPASVAQTDIPMFTGN